MRRAAEISIAGHARQRCVCAAGAVEQSSRSGFEHEFIRHGARTPRTTTSRRVPRTPVLHYNDSNRKMQDGDMLLIDAGCEYAGYASDITRTFPVNGKFTGPQRDVYQAVLDAELGLHGCVKAGNPFNEYHEVAIRVLSQRTLDPRPAQGHASIRSLRKRPTPSFICTARSLDRHGRARCR